MLACPECRAQYPDGTSECSADGSGLLPAQVLADEDATLEPGTKVGEYRVDRLLGAGTFGDVYAGEQPLIGKKVAIKVLHKRFAFNGSVVSRFVAEARAVNKIRHRNIIDIFSFGLIDEELPYFVMELLDGLTLGELLAKRGRIDLAEALPILEGIADALDAAHENGITHRDLKPDNIFLATQKDGSHFPKLLDFGVAKLIDDELAHKTASGAAIGTPRYMAPEQCRGLKVDHRADVYALGVVIHEMLTGRRLFDGESAVDVLLKHTAEPPKPMSSVRPEIPKELDAPVLAMLAKQPAARPSSAGKAVAALIERARASGAAIPAKPGSGPTSTDQALGRIETPTVRVAKAGPDDETRTIKPDRAVGHDDPTSAPVEARSGPGASDTSGPVVISVGGSRKEDSVESARTAMAPSSPASGTLLTAQGTADPAPMAPGVDTTVPSKPMDPTVDEVPRPRPSRGHHGPQKASPWPWIAVVAGAGVIGAMVLTRGRPDENRHAATGQAPATAETAREASGKITLRLSVTPANADVILDGLRVGSAADPLVLPRSDKNHTLRVEKEGFEPQTLLLALDRDIELPPMALRAAAPPASATAAPSGAPSAKPAVKPKGGDLDLERPPELKR